MPKQKPEWEKEFDEIFSLPPEIGDMTAGFGFLPPRRPIFQPYEKVKAFIRQLLSHQRKEIISEIEKGGKMKKIWKKINNFLKAWVIVDYHAMCDAYGVRDKIYQINTPLANPEKVGK